MKTRIQVGDVMRTQDDKRYHVVDVNVDGLVDHGVVIAHQEGLAVYGEEIAAKGTN